MDFLIKSFPIPAIIAMLSGFMLSLLFTRMALYLLPRSGMLDIPRGRHQHEHPVPRGGGIAIILSVTVSVGVYFALKNDGLSCYDQKLLYHCLPPFLLIGVLGILDDRFELKGYIKLVFQITAALYLYFSGASIDYLFGFALPEYLALPLTICWVVGLVNAFNLIDGVDGVASGLAVISAAAMIAWLLISGGEMTRIVLLGVFLCSSLGFLVYNFPPAKIFLGDTGSMFIGLFFAYFSMMEMTKKMTLTTFFVPILFMGIPIFDVCLAIVRRAFRKYILKQPDIGIMNGDHDHLHHRIQAQMKDTRKTALQIYLLALLLTCGGFTAAFFDDSLPFLSLVILIGIFFVLIRYATIESYEFASLLFQGSQVPRGKFLSGLLHPLLDTLFMSLSFFLSRSLVLRTGFLTFPNAGLFLCCVLPYPLILGISGIYRTYWLRVGIARYYRFFWLLLSASLAAFILSICCLLYQGIGGSLYQFQEFFIVYVLIGLNMIFIERFFMHYIESYSFRNLAASIRETSDSVPKTLIYGGGLGCRLFLISQFSCSTQETERSIVGIIDDNPALKGLNIYGLKVIGSLEDLYSDPALCRVEEIIVTLQKTTKEQKRMLNAISSVNNVRIFFFHCLLYEENQQHTSQTDNSMLHR